MAELSSSKIEELIATAAECRANAYAPYSKFPVGAALLSSNGKIFKGCNVENSSYGLCICAERSAIVAAVTAGETKFDAIAVMTELDPPASPCGTCRQFMVEFSPDMKVILAGPKGTRRIMTAAELLPGYFKFNS